MILLRRKSGQEVAQASAALFTPLVTIGIVWYLSDLLAREVHATSKVGYWVAGILLGTILAIWEVSVMMRRMKQASYHEQIAKIYDPNEQLHRKLLEDTRLEEELINKLQKSSPSSHASSSSSSSSSSPSSPSSANRKEKL